MFKCERISKSIYSKKDRIIVIGDLHGDYNNTLLVFKKLKLIDNDLNWIAFPKQNFFKTTNKIINYLREASQQMPLFFVTSHS